MVFLWEKCLDDHKGHSIELMSEQIRRFKESLKYKFDGYDKILNGFEFEAQKEEYNDNAIDEIVQAFEDIK